MSKMIRNHFTGYNKLLRTVIYVMRFTSFMSVWQSRANSERTCCKSTKYWEFVYFVWGPVVRWRNFARRRAQTMSKNIYWVLYLKGSSLPNQESCAIAKMTARPRDVRYISRSWAVAEIWPFEIIQDGDSRHLEFVRTVDSAVRSAVPENPTLEPNMKWIGSPAAEIWPFAYDGAYGTPFWGKGRS